MLSKYNPSVLNLRDDFLFPFEQAFNKFFDEFCGSPLNGLKSSSGYPKMDVSYTDKNFIITAAVPGVEPENLKVEITKDRILNISGKMSEEYNSPEGTKYYSKELRKSQFIRSISLPKGIEGDPEANIKNGILILKWDLPEIQEEVTSKIIEIKKN